MLTTVMVEEPDVIEMGCSSIGGSRVVGSGRLIGVYWIELCTKNAIPPPRSLVLSSLTMLWLGALILHLFESLVSCNAAILMLYFSMKLRISCSFPLNPLQFHWSSLSGEAGAMLIVGTWL